MITSEIIKEIQNLPLSKRINVLKKTLQLIRKQEDKISLKNAADALFLDYTTDKELITFTSIDFKDYYKTT